MVKSTSIILKMKTAVVSFSTKEVHIVTTALETSSQDSIKKEQEKRGTSVYLSISISFIIFSDSIIVSQLQNSTFIFWTITKHCYGILHKKKKKKKLRERRYTKHMPKCQFLGKKTLVHQSKQDET